MKPSTHTPISHARDSSPDASTVKTLTPPAGASGCFITVETTAARVTFDTSDPSAASAPSLVLPKDSLPVFFPIGSGSTIKWVSTAGTASVVQVLWLA